MSAPAHLPSTPTRKVWSAQFTHHLLEYLYDIDQPLACLGLWKGGAFGSLGLELDIFRPARCLRHWGRLDLSKGTACATELRRAWLSYLSPPNNVCVARVGATPAVLRTSAGSGFHPWAQGNQRTSPILRDAVCQSLSCVSEAVGISLRILYDLDSAHGAAEGKLSTRGFERMTYLEVLFNYGAIPGENELRAIDGMREVYGIRRVQVMPGNTRCESSMTRRGSSRMRWQSCCGRLASTCGKRWRWPEWVSLRWRGLGRARAGPTLGRSTVNRDAPKKRKGRSRGGLTADGDVGERGGLQD